MRAPWRVTACVGVALAVTLTGCKSEPDSAGALAAPPIKLRAVTESQVARLDHAETLKDEGSYADALGLFQEILAENPTITTAYVGIGDIYIEQNDYAKAEPAYRRAARLEPRNFEAQYGHGLALEMLARFVDAVRAYRLALIVEPDSAKANLNLANTYLRMSETRLALEFAERAVRYDPANGPAHASLGTIYENLSRYAEAIEEFTDALELMGNRPHLMMNLISVLSNERRYREAAITAETLVKIEPSAAALERLGWCYFKLKRFDESIDAYRDAVDLDARYWPALNGIGVNALNAWLLSEKRDSDAMIEARDAFRRSLRANSNQEKVIKLMLNYNL